jgi:hypothetical protein
MSAINQYRELVFRQPSNTNGAALSCMNCKWGIILEPVSGLVTDKEVDEAFNGHRCEEYP